MHRMQSLAATLALGTGLMLSAAAHALEYPIGTPHNVAGMEIAAVYLQPIDMEPEGHMRKAAETDIHLEADIHALANNPNGFPEGFWMPHLLVKYELVKQGTNEVIKGDMMPMVASDGPHYGDNVKLLGAGKYTLTLTVQPPGGGQHAHFGRHVDKETGVAPWFKPFEARYEFSFAGTGKKGGY